MGRSFTHNGKKHIEIEIAEVIVGEAQNSGGTPADGPPVFVFSPGTTFATPSTEFKRGARVAIYFKGNPDRGWSLLTVQALTQSTERFRAKVRAARTETSESPSKRRRK